MIEFANCLLFQVFQNILPVNMMGKFILIRILLLLAAISHRQGFIHFLWWSKKDSEAGGLDHFSSSFSSFICVFSNLIQQFRRRIITIFLYMRRSSLTKQRPNHTYRLFSSKPLRKPTKSVCRLVIFSLPSSVHRQYTSDPHTCVTFLSFYWWRRTSAGTFHQRSVSSPR